MKDKIRQIVYEDYSNTLGIVAYKDNKKVYEEYFNNATKEYNTGKYNSWCANGVGGSIIAVIPEKNIVICCACSLVYNPKIRTDLINNYLIPYIDSLEY